MLERHRWLIGLAGGYFLIAGVLGLGYAGLVAFTSGFDGADLLGAVIAATSALLLLAAAARLIGRRAWLSVHVLLVGGVVAIPFGLAPLAGVASLIDQGYITAGPIELTIGALPLAWAIVGAVIATLAWRADDRAARLGTRRPKRS